jgi:gamma-butyrobetaine dioxygenase
VEGGTSVFVDSIKAAEDLRVSHPAYFDILTQFKIPFHYINDGHHLYHTHPTIQLDSSAQEIKHVNFSPPFQAPLPLDTPKEFYDALRTYNQILHRSENVFRYLLREGDAVIFDNRRVLHARTAFRDIPGQEAKEGEANRWLKGCYIEGDAMWDKGRVLCSAV